MKHAKTRDVVDKYQGKQAEMDTRVIAEIVTYLKLLLATGKTEQINQIQEFTRSFKGYKKFTVADYIDRASQTLRSLPSDHTVSMRPTKYTAAMNDFSIAMPPNVLTHYIKEMWSSASTLTMAPTGKQILTVNDTIVGIACPSEGKKKWNYLVHYFYVDQSGTAYNWGQTGSSVHHIKETGAYLNIFGGKSYHRTYVCCTIKIA